MKTKTTAFDVVASLLAVVFVLAYGAWMLSDTDDKARVTCGRWLQAATTPAESTAVLSDRPQRATWRDFAATCRELRGATR